MSAQPPLLPPPPGASVEAPPPPPEPGSARRSRMPLLVGFAVLSAMVLIVGSLALWLSAPGRCDNATFTSERFGYCMTAPAGWTAETARVGDTPVDRFLAPDGPTVVYVQAVALDQGQDVHAFSDFVRSVAEQSGFTLGQPSEFQIDGVAAVSWDKSEAAPTTSGTIVREVVFVRGDTAWRVQFADTADGFDAHKPTFEEMLGSWHFA
jgi:hypothetical protein